MTQSVFQDHQRTNQVPPSPALTMAEGLSAVAEKLSMRKENRMSGAETVALEMQAIIRDAASPFEAGDTVGRQIDRAARRLGIPVGKCKRIWYGEYKTVLAWEADQLRAWHEDWQSQQVRKMDHQLAILKAKMENRECSHA
ncbi:hypothetical protein [Acetobacter sp. P5B1]|uniref:hypothetical protein n=1 Tax=Acetobacter sp. P5B1 TaxID=2762620 RepID=UPI001C04B9C8|nr:hypothetical protein [Acetobacter sp. P5B1]